MNKKVIVLIGSTLISFLFSTGIFLHSIQSTPKNSKTRNLTKFSIASGVVPHHLVAKKIIEKFFQYISSKGKPQDIILLSPDHFHAANLAEKKFVSIDPGSREFHNLAVNNYLLQKLNDYDLAFDRSAVNLDHGITALLPYFKKYFPESGILPIMISSQATKEDVVKLVETIHTFAGPRTIVMASVDFSHYLPPPAADFHDVKSIAALVDFKENDFKELEVDSWQALYGARLFAKLQGKEFYNIIGRGKSSDFLKNDDLVDTQGITSYCSVVFEKKNNQKTIEKGKTVLLVGDIMLDRGVGSLIKKNNVIYPFRKISRFLRGVDIVFSNLEGPIVKEPRNFSFASLKFSFLHQAADGLSWANFNLLALANNHTLDRGENGLKETKQFLKEKNIDFAGDPIKCTKDFIFKKDDIVFLAFNKTFPFSCADEGIVNTIKSVKSINPESFLIVSLHWGEEYQKKNSISQRELAHKIIGAGADAIVGHHPHMVQNIEIFQSKPIFYSLGNFVFDQYFSKDTQAGLAVGIEIYNSRIRYRLFPFKSRQSQPSLLSRKETDQFLEELALRSSPELLDKIRNGIINLGRPR